MPPQARQTLVLELQVRENVGRTRAAMRDLAADTDRAAKSVDDLGRRMDRAAERAERLAAGGRAVREMETRDTKRTGAIYGFADEKPTGGTAGTYGLLPAERVRGRATALSTAERYAIDRRAADEQVRRRLEFQEPPGERLRPGQANQIIRDAALLRAGGATSEGGLLGGLGRFAGPIAGLFTASTLARFAKTRSAAAQDEGIYDDQRQRLVAQSIPLGSTFQEYSDVFSGRARSLARLQEQQPIRMAEVQGDIRLGRFQREQEARVGGLQNRADVLGRTRPELLPTGIDRTTAEGERRYQMERRLLAVRKEAADADQEAAVAAKDRAKAQDRLNGLLGKEKEIDAQRERFQDRLDFTNRNAEQLGTAAERRRALYRGDLVGAATRTDEDPAVTRQRLLGQLEDNSTRKQALQEDKAKAAQDIEAARTQEAEAARRKRLTGASRLEIEAQDAEDRAFRILGGQRQIGALGYQGRNEALEAARAGEQLKKVGFEKLTDRQRALVERFAPETAAKESQEAGKRSPLLPKLNEAFPNESQYKKDNPDQLLGQATAKRNEAEQIISEANKGVADLRVKYANELAKLMLDTARESYKADIQAVKEALARLKAGQGG